MATTLFSKAQLRDMILECVESGLERTADISKRIGLTSKRVATRLNYLRSIGLVNSTPTVDERGVAIYLWRPGPALDAQGQPTQAAPKKARRSQHNDRIVVITKIYQPIGMRDPWVAALFGAPATTTAAERNHP